MGIVTTLHANTSSLLLIASLVAAIGSPIFAATVHEACNGTQHTCAQLAPEACCCAGAVGTNALASQDRTYTGNASVVRTGDVPIVRMDVAGECLRHETRLFTHPVLCILFVDLRL
jgi:hypothetical protein